MLITHVTMFKYLLIFLVFWCKIRANDVYTQTDTDITLTNPSDYFLPCPPTSQLSLNSDTQNSTEESSKKTVIINGHNNHHVDQQIFYVGDNHFLKRLLLNKNGSFTSGNTDTHKFYPYKATWNQARQACIREGGHLAIIDSKSEERILLHMLQEKNVDAAWLGLHDLYEEGDWVSVLDQNLQDLGYAEWSNIWPNQPDNRNGYQNCATIIKTGGMDDVSCDVMLNFFCEFSA